MLLLIVIIKGDSNFMKKFTKLFLIPIFALFCSIGLVACGRGGGTTSTNNEPLTPGVVATEGLAYTLIDEDSAYSVSKGTATDTKIVIPATYNNLPVTMITSNGFSFTTSITEVIIPDSITKIDNSAFRGCTNLTEVEIPNGVRDIGYYAFLECSKLKTLTIQNGVTDIGSSAFSRMALESLIIPDSVVNVGDRAFSENTKLTTVTMGAGIKWISTMFEKCTAMVSIEVSVNNQILASENGILYNKEKTIIAHVPKAIAGIVDLPESLLKISHSAFSECINIEEIIIPESVETIDNYAFFNCKKLTTIELPEKLATISFAMFSGCSSLDNIIIPDNVKLIDTYAFINCSSIETITIPASVETFGEYSIFDGCTNLTSICTHLDNTKFSSKDGILYNKTKTEIIFVPQAISGSITIPGSVLNIGTDAFKDRDKIVNIVLEEGLQTITESAFSGCTSLENMTVPFVGLSLIENNYFYLLFGSVTSSVPLSLKKVTVTSGNIIKAAFGTSSGITSIAVLGGGDTVLNDNAFSGCQNLENLTIGAGVSNISNKTILGLKKLTNITIDEGNTLYRSESNCIIRNFDDELIAGCKTSVIPDSVKSIGQSAFQLSSITEIIIPDGVKSIGISAFEGSSLTRIVISGSVTRIEARAFDTCTSLIDLTIEDGVEYIGIYAFQLCNKLTTLLIPDSVTTIEYAAFKECFKLTSISIGKGLKNLDTWTFYECRDLMHITVDDENETFRSEGNCLIARDDEVLVLGCKNSIIPEDILKIGNEAFDSCEGLLSVTIPDGVTSIGNNAFRGCINLTTIILPEGLETIGSWAFGGCSALESIVIPASLKDIEFSGFGFASYETRTGLSIVFYGGKDITEWDAITYSSDPNNDNRSLTEAPRYYYSEEEPIEEGNFWYWSEEGIPRIWE